MTKFQRAYETGNIAQAVSEEDAFTLERYEQFYKFFPKGTKKILDMGCNTGRGGMRLKELDPSLEISGMDCVRERVDMLPDIYCDKIYGIANDIPKEDRYFDVVIAGEFVEHLFPGDVDQVLCELQRVLKVGGRLMLTTPNPGYIRNKISKSTIYVAGHLSQHYPKILKLRFQMHGFSKINIYGSGKMSRYLGYHFPLKLFYGSYLIIGDKY